MEIDLDFEAAYADELEMMREECDGKETDTLLYYSFGLF